LGIGVWRLGIGPTPRSPIPNPQSPIPNYCFSFVKALKKLIIKIKDIINKLIIKNKIVKIPKINQILIALSIQYLDP